MSKEQELKEMLKLYSKQDLWNRIQEKQAMIYDLEAKLAEKQKENATLEAMLMENANDRKTMQEFKIGEDGYDLTDEDARNSLCWEVEELKQQLTEKERQVKKLNLEAQKYYEDAYCNDFHNQDKISFAIAELEKVKNIIKNKVEIIDKRLDNLNIKIVCENTSMQLDTYEEISKEIDNQIASLKK